MKLFRGKMTDTVSHPVHYNLGQIEVIDFIEDQKLGFHLGNALKYIARAGRKDPQTYNEDLKKAIWYIEREMQYRTSLNSQPPSTAHLRTQDLNSVEINP